MELTTETDSRPIYLFLKRCFDILFSLTFLIVFSPIYLMIALLIKWDSTGPILFLGKRLGKGGKTIRILKFRTMYTGAEKKLKHILQNNPDMQQEWDEFQKIQQDPRCTPIGKFLRKTSLDEFPQFLNVLIGDLSVVGPRPYFVSELYDPASPFKKDAHQILSVKPGITGLWQTSGRNQLSFEKRVKLDVLYVQKHTFALDVLMIWRTISTVLQSKGAS